MHESMFYISLIWCYCDILEPSIKTSLTCLTCLQLWLVVSKYPISQARYYLPKNFKEIIAD